MEEHNLLITVAALFTAGAVYLFGYIHGHRSGKADQISESENRATKLAVRKERELMYQD